MNYVQEQKKRRTGGNRYDAVHARDTDECKTIISEIPQNARGSVYHAGDKAQLLGAAAL